MNSEQKKILGGVLFMLGLLVGLYGLMGIYSVYDANSQLAAMNRMTGGLFDGWAAATGHSLKASYLVPVITALAGLACAVLGWGLIGKVTSRKRMRRRRA